MTKTKSQKNRAKAQRAAGAKPAGGARKPRGKGQPRQKKQSQPFIGPRQKRGTANRQKQKNLRTFAEILVSDGLNKALQMHNSASIIDHFPRRMEKVMDIIPTSTSFAILQALYLNPGNSVLFPIFSQIASIYEQFRCRFLRFHYVSEAYTASGSNVSAGKIIMATNVDPNDNQFVNATQMENYAGADRSAPFSNMSHDVMLCIGKNREDWAIKTFFVNPGANTASPSNDTTDKFFDMGLFQFATSGLPSASNVEYGELYVEYEFDMIRPKQQTPLGQDIQASHIRGATSMTAAAPFGTAPTNTGNVVTTVGTTTFTLPVGRWVLALEVFGTVITAAPAFSAGSGATILTALQGNTNTQAQMFPVGATTAMSLVEVDVTVANAIITVGTLAATTITNSDLFISQVPSIVPVFGIEEEKKEIDHLKNQVQELGKMMRALLVRIPDDEEKELEILPNPKRSRGNGEILDKGEQLIRDKFGQLTPSTTPSEMASRKNWFGSSITG